MLRKFYRFATDEGFFWPLVAGLSVVPALVLVLYGLAWFLYAVSLLPWPPSPGARP